MEKLWLKDVLGMYTVLLQELHGGIIPVFQECMFYILLAQRSVKSSALDKKE